MKVHDWESLKHWLASIGPKNANLSIDYILSIPNKERDGWRRRVMKFAPLCHFSGVVTSFESEPRGGLMLWVSTNKIQSFPLLISSDKKQLIEKAFPKLHSNTALVITFTPYVHYQHGLIGMVKECELCVEPVRNEIIVNAKIMPKSALPKAEPIWDANKDQILLDRLEKDTGIRAIATELEVTPIKLLGHMVRLGVIDENQFNEMKLRLKELGYS